MPAVIAVSLIASGVTASAQIYAAKKGADAAKDASDAQVASGDKALALQQQQYQNAQQQLAPYQQFGIDSLNSLGGLMAAKPYQPFVPGQPNTFAPPPAAGPAGPSGAAPQYQVQTPAMLRPQPALVKPPWNPTLGQIMSPGHSPGATMPGWWSQTQ